MEQDQININKLKSTLLSTIEYANDSEHYMPLSIVEAQQEYKKFNNMKKEFGYSALPVDMAHITELGNKIQNYMDFNNNLHSKIKFFCNQEDISPVEKFIQLESLIEVVKPRNGKVKEKSLSMVDNEINFALNKYKSKLNNIIPEHRDKIDFIEKSLNQNNKIQNKKKASI